MCVCCFLLFSFVFLVWGTLVGEEGRREREKKIKERAIIGEGGMESKNKIKYKMKYIRVWEGVSSISRQPNCKTKK